MSEVKTTYKCQPSLSNPCLTESQIIGGGGDIVHQIDGSVGVWINTEDGLRPYNNINTKTCCEYLGYIFDVENQKCLWDDSISCDTCEMKIVINPNGNDGDYFFVGENSNCSLDISLDYIFKFDCDIFKSAQTINQSALEIQNQLDELNQELENKESECSSLSGQCVYYTNIYTGMCYTILLGKHLADYDEFAPASSLKTPVLPPIPAFSTVCCLTDAGLERWNTILGDIKYNAWLSANGCDTTIYTTTQSDQLYNEGNDFAIQNNVPNPYFETTDNDICDKQNAFLQKEEACSEYQNCLDEIAELQAQIAELQAQLDLLVDEGVLCDDPIANLENFTAWFSLDAETETPNLYETVYEEQIFGIGEGNLMQYIIDESPLTGIIISGDSGVLPPFGVETTCGYDDICKEYRDAFIRELYLGQYLANNDAPATTLENNELLSLMGGWYNSSWLNYVTTITDPDVIDKIKNKKIRISIKVNTCCLDFGLLLDKIKVTQNCENIDNTYINITKPIGFELDKFVDNKKSWVSSESPERRTFYLDWRNTEYNISHYNLAINTKEIDLNIDPAKAIEGDVFKYIFDNPCAIGCSSASTILEMGVNIDFENMLNDEIANCIGCSTCFYQKQLQNYECFDLMNGEPYEFQFQEPITGSITGCVKTVIWGIKAQLDGVEVYNNSNFLSGSTEYTIPTQSEFLNELNNIANAIGSIFIINGNLVSFVGKVGCDNSEVLSGKNLNIDLNISVEVCDIKKFEDYDCFGFMDGIDYEFEA